MTDVASALPSAGWYADPTSSDRLRWWDGLGWSQNSMPAPVASPEPSAPPMSQTPTVDEHRLIDSPRRSSRVARPLRDENDLAPVTQLRPLPTPSSADVIDVDRALLSRPAAPQPVVPPVTVPQDATPSAAVEHLPQLGLVPDQVFAPEPVAVVAAPVAAPVAPVAAVAPAPAEVVAAGTMPTPGQLVAAPMSGDAVDPFTGRSAAAPAPVATVAAGAAAGVAVAAVPMTLPAGLPGSPAEFGFAAAPVAPTAAPAEVAAPTAPRQAERRTPAQDDEWWVGLVPSTASTLSAWMLAIAPVASVAVTAASLAVVLWLPQFVIGLSAVGLLALLLPFALAIADRRRLISLGWMRPASPAFMLLGPFWYLIARQAILGKQGAKVNPLLAVTIALGLLVPAATYAATMLFSEQLRVLMLILELRY